MHKVNGEIASMGLMYYTLNAAAHDCIPAAIDQSTLYELSFMCEGRSHAHNVKLS